jgi:hypothetical protein
MATRQEHRATPRLLEHIHNDPGTLTDNQKILALFAYLSEERLIITSHGREKLIKTASMPSMTNVHYLLQDIYPSAGISYDRLRRFLHRQRAAYPLLFTLTREGRSALTKAIVTILHATAGNETPSRERVRRMYAMEREIQEQWHALQQRAKEMHPEPLCIDLYGRVRQD